MSWPQSTPVPWTGPPAIVCRRRSRLHLRLGPPPVHSKSWRHGRLIQRCRSRSRRSFSQHQRRSSAGVNRGPTGLPRTPSTRLTWLFVPAMLRERRMRSLPVGVR
ncbi:hypothetical protein CONLIGDRAFT_719331 [Coniochaeta ligniaria NRRL 30616]|uniref:Uncharacterized protein n=1 Tax=Coniochaeta ligniaria NRRL 30616 TaxID=1408157 RepID=A0A1J7IRK1_9PEZI|nr:hypothetical protein CONLIGDRAFT_719331 [Coniochaeta ligniaria NRRL 30616]